MERDGFPNDESMDLVAINIEKKLPSTTVGPQLSSLSHLLQEGLNAKMSLTQMEDVLNIRLSN